MRLNVMESCVSVGITLSTMVKTVSVTGIFNETRKWDFVIWKCYKHFCIYSAIPKVLKQYLFKGKKKSEGGLVPLRRHSDLFDYKQSC